MVFITTTFLTHQPNFYVLFFGSCIEKLSPLISESILFQGKICFTDMFIQSLINVMSIFKHLSHKINSNICEKHLNTNTPESASEMKEFFK